MQEARVSIALCTFNGARFLTEQLQSLARQTLQPLEIVIGDDGSTDNTLELIKQFADANTSIPIRLLPFSRQLGYRHNFIRTAESCSGDMVAFCDQDDVWRNDKLEVAARTLIENDALLFHHAYRLVDADLGPLSGDSCPDVGVQLSSKLSVSPWTFPLGFSIVFRRELLTYGAARMHARDHLQPEQPIAHDVWISLLANMLGRTAYSSEVLVDYRQHGGNLFGCEIKSEAGQRWVEKGKRALRFCNHRELAETTALINAAVRSMGFEDEAPGEVYSRIEKGYRLRSDCYNNASVLSRLDAWNRLRRAGFYDVSSSVNFQNHSILRDAFLGALFKGIRERFGSLHNHDYTLRLNWLPNYIRSPKSVTLQESVDDDGASSVCVS